MTFDVLHGVIAGICHRNLFSHRLDAVNYGFVAEIEKEEVI